MSSKKEITIDYLDRKTKVLLPEKYSDFIKLCKETFYISESRSQYMCLKYDDEDGDEIDLEEEDYENEKVRKCSNWKLILNDNDNETDDTNLKDELIRIKNKILKQVKDFKSTKIKESNEQIEKEIKKRNEVHKQNIEKIKNEYKTKIEEFKTEIKEMIKNSLDDVSKSIKETYKKNIEIVDNEIKKDLKTLVINVENECKQKLNDINMEDIGEHIETMEENVSGCQKDFIEIYNKSKYVNAICQIDEKIEVNEQISKKGVKFKINIKNLTNKKLNGKYFLDIRGSEGNNDNYQVKLDLSDINSGEIKSKEISFNSSPLKEGEYKYTLGIKEDNNIISNQSELKLKLTELGSNENLFE